MGRKKQPHFRVVIADGTSPRDGRFVETIGYYKPLSTPARLVLDLERVDYWLKEGASPSDTVRSLISKARRGGTDDVAVGEVAQEEREAKRAEVLASKRAAERKAAKAAEAPVVPAEPAAEAAGGEASE
jgi:small subunit ribosomal protein S16